MEAAAKLSSKGQVTVPKDVRDALGIEQGDTIIFRVHEGRAFMERTPDFVSLAGSLAVPPAKRNVPWNEVLKRSRSARAAKAR